jgi:hypothetical protein
MKTFVTSLGTAAVAAALVLTGSPSAQADTPSQPCPDAGAPIVQGRVFSSQVAVGTTKTQRLELEVWTHAGCDVTAAKAVVRSPRVTRAVQLEPVEVVEGEVRWRGSLAISPRSLRNSDAGGWPTTYQVTGDHADTETVTSLVRRATRVTSFNAGPEPVRNGRITYSGHVERANWDRRRYDDLAGHVVGVQRIWLDEEESELVAAPRTRKDGTFRVTKAYAGPGHYVAVPHENRTTASSQSRRDTVTTSQ